MKKRLIDIINEKGISCLAIIGMAKNTGKTVTFNSIVQEASSHFSKIALVSYGRDGEKIDSLTLKKKPRIKVWPGNFFVTAEKIYQASKLRAELLKDTGYHTPFANLNIYRSKEKGNVELIGLNSLTQLKEIKKYLAATTDLMLIDGALDRSSSAVPELAEGVILSTGAVIASTIKKIVEKTDYRIKLLTIPGLRNQKVRALLKEAYAREKNILIDKQGNIVELEDSTCFSSRELENKFKYTSSDDYQYLFLKGAFVDKLAEALLNKLKLKDWTIIVKDGSKIFIKESNYNLLAKNNIKLRAFNQIKILAITANPYSPYGIQLKSCCLLKGLRDKFPDIPVYDLLSDEYLNLERRNYE